MLIRFLAVTVIVLVFSIFSIKSSKLDFESDYPELRIKGDRSIIINETVFSLFSDNFTISLEADGYEDKIFKGRHSLGINKIKLAKEPIRIGFSGLQQTPSLIFINGSEYELDDALLKEGMNEVYLEFKNFLPLSTNILIDTEDYYLLQKELVPISKKIIFLNLTKRDKVFINNMPNMSERIAILEDRINKISISRDGKTMYEQTLVADNNDDKEILLERYVKKTPINLAQKNVDIFVNDKYIGNSVEYLSDLSVGDVITFTKKNYYSDKQNYEKQEYFNINLKPKSGSLLIRNKQNAIATISSKELKAFKSPAKLMVGDYEIIFKAKGFASETKKIRINENKLTEVFVELLTIKEKAIKEAKKNYENVVGLNLILNNPGKIIIGSDTSEFRRNKNEIKRKVLIKRHFYLSDTLVSNKQFNQIMSNTPGDNLPVTNIDWIQAAIFCNKLSKKEGFKPFYIIKNSKIIGFDTSSKGYRLPTESEWEYVISLPDKGGKKQKIYPWGNSGELKETIANLSDEGSGKENIIKNYTDGHKKLSPSKSYPKTALGYYDFLGNAKEWTNDFYTEEISITDNQFIEDYIGPTFGKTHVIKGSSYLSFNLSELGISYRDDSEKGQEDLSFRVARWIY
tara:strand:+ start:5053 stop:6936 length:1884 start_codon:yes stop_codon:yes gene_type:complete